MAPPDHKRGRTVKRGLEDISVQVPEGEADKVDHLVVMVHGIGAACDIQMRGIVQCVNDFRSISLDLLTTHFSQDMGRVEFLPVNWHQVLHGNTTGVDKDIQKITLPSISRLRQFSNSTVLDLLFYNSPTYCQTITDTVGREINRLHRLFLHRHPEFTGKVSLAGHSLGSLILFDLLTNQENLNTDPETAQASTSNPMETSPLPSESLEETLENNGLGDYIDILKREQMDYQSLALCSESDLAALGIPLGPRKKMMCIARRRRVAELESRRGQPFLPPVWPPGKAGEDSQAHTPSILNDACATRVDLQHFDICIGQAPVVYPQLAFQPQAFFALGSPIGMYLTVRGLKQIHPNYSLPTCKSFYNIYHPFDPVAYRIEPLVPGVQLAPVLIPHYKGRKRMHLELKDSFARVGSDLLLSLGTLRSVWQTLTQIPLTASHQEEGHGTTGKLEGGEAQDSAVSSSSPTELQEQRTITIGMLNGGRRFDYVLQEKPIESFNEYLFAIQSHLCYWESQDTALLVLKEMYKGTGIFLKKNQAM
ncbi:triacylglycerol hydrolase DDHD2-like [Aplochiton taeniatus]